MPKAKKESILEKAEDTIKDVAEKVEKVVEEIVEEVKDVAEEVVEKVTGKKKDSEETPTTEPADDKKAKLAKLKAKAEKLAGKVKGEEVEIRKDLKEPEKETLIPIEDYLKSSIHLGTRAITPDMKPYVYKRRADSLAVFNTALLDDKIREAADFLANYAPEDIVLVCKREAGHKAAELFSEVTGIRTFTKKYPAGILTNPNLENFLETEAVFICDPWTDKNALSDALKIKVPVLGVCDTNNYSKGINQVLPANNKSSKSLGMIFYLLSKLYVEKRKIKVQVPLIQEFIDGWDNLVPPK